MRLVSVYRQLDQTRLSEAAIEYLEGYEGSSEFVLHEQPRDLGWTQEVAEATIAYLLVDDDDNILAKFSASQMEEAERAAASATVKLDIVVPTGDGAEDDDEDDEIGLPVVAPAAALA